MPLDSCEAILDTSKESSTHSVGAVLTGLCKELHDKPSFLRACKASLQIQSLSGKAISLLPKEMHFASQRCEMLQNSFATELCLKVLPQLAHVPLSFSVSLGLESVREHPESQIFDLDIVLERMPEIFKILTCLPVCQKTDINQ